MTTTPAPVTGPKTNTLAIISLVAGILSFNIIAVILGHIALGQIKRTGEGGRTLAIVGLVLGYIAIVVYVILIIVFVVGVGVYSSVGSN